MKVDPKIVIWLALYHVMEDITNIYTTVKTTHVNPAKRNVMVVKNEMRLLKQKRNVLQI